MLKNIGAKGYRDKCHDIKPNAGLSLWPSDAITHCGPVMPYQVEAQHQMWKVSQIWQTFQIWWYRMLKEQPCGLEIAVS